jgi:hypothetical protein
MRIRVQDNKGNHLCSFNVGGFAGDIKAGGKHFRLSGFKGCSLSEIEKDPIGTFVFIQIEQDFTNQLKQLEDGTSSE